MIPVRLAIQGLYSYQERQEVDFSHLVSTSMFGIFGRVGSGKTSLLEAISFVLYGETERLNGRDNRQYNMMNLKSSSMTIDFEFRAGVNQQLYKFLYKAERHPKKHHEIKSNERRAFQWIDDQWAPLNIEREDIGAFSTSILGLDYDNFKRTIIIPQNQFREFLELSPKDRTEMMSRLFRLTKFDLSSPVSRLSTANDTALAVVAKELEPLIDASLETIEEASKRIHAVSEEIAQKGKQIDGIVAEENRLTQLQIRHKELEGAKLIFENLRLQKETFQKTRDQIQQFEQCQLLFKALFEQIEGVYSKQADLAGKLQTSKKKLADTDKAWPDLQTAYETAKSNYENRGVLEKQSEELDTVLLIRTLQVSVENQNRNLRQLRSEIDTYDQTLDKHKTERIKQQNTIDRLLGGESKLEQLYEIQNWFVTYNLLEKQVADYEKQLQNYESAVQRIKLRKDKALIGFPEEWNELSLKNLPAQIETAITSLNEVHEQRLKTHQQNLLKQELHQYAGALTEGEPCPLCGSQHHPAKLHSREIDLEVDKSEKALDKVKKRLREVGELQRSTDILLQELRSTHDNGKRLINDRTETVARRTAHEDLFVWKAYTMADEEKVKKAIDQDKKDQKDLQEARKAVQTLNDAIETAENNKKEIELKTIRLQSERDSLTDTIENHLKTLVHYTPQSIHSFSAKDINDLKDELNTKFKSAKTEFENAQDAKSNAEIEKAKLTEQVRQLTEQQAGLLQETDNLEGMILSALAENQYTRAQVKQILTSTINLAQEKQRVMVYDQEFNTAVTNLAVLTTELAEKPFDPEELQSVQQQLKALKQENNSLNQQLGKEEKKHKELIEKLEQQQEVQKRFDQLTLRQKDLKELDGLFRGQGFVKYVSTVYLKELCQTANERFTNLTNNQLRLEFDDGNFVVRDFLNGGETRLAKTLSGGQMFQAALSLALALSDNVQHLTQSKQNLFFLDEGFGTLDKAALQTVFETLKQLRRENRIVGIISHVEELQQEIDTYIRTEQTEKGSRIVRSWEELT